MRRRSGFTLIEVMVALAVSGLVLVTAAAVFAGVGDSGRALVASREALDREANARRWLKATLLSLEVGIEPGTSFEGRPGEVRFSAWQQTSGGWLEPRRIALGLVKGSFVAAAGSRLVLADSVTDVAFDYLLEPGADRKWVREWISPVSAPVAVRVRLQRGTRKSERGTAGVDTLLFLIKERG